MTTEDLLHSPRAFVGIPWVARGDDFSGADCWGLVRIAALHLYGLQLPRYFYSEVDLLPDAAALIAAETTGPRWQALEGLAAFPPGVVHIFRIKGLKTHCGLSLGAGEFLHSLPGHDSAIENLADLQWRQRRTGTYRWTDL